MTSRTLAARLLAPVLVLLVAVPFGGRGPDQFFCRMMNRVTTACCCAAMRAAHDVKAASDVAEIEDEGCCRLQERSERSATPAVHELGFQVSPAAVMSASLPIVRVPEPRFRVIELTPVQARAPPPPGVPIYIEHCALLS